MINFKTLALILKGKVFEICKKNLVNCPWYLKRESTKHELVDIIKVCDLKFDCEDQSNEKYCSKTTHFNCTTGYLVSIDRNKVNDYGLGLADLSGECRENYVSSAKQMIKNPYLLNYIYNIIIIIIVIYAEVLVKSFR